MISTKDAIELRRETLPEGGYVSILRLRSGKIAIKRFVARGSVVNLVDRYERVDKDDVSIQPLDEAVANQIVDAVLAGKKSWAACFVVGEFRAAPIDWVRSEAEKKYTSVGNKFWRHREQMESYRAGTGQTAISTHISPEGSCNLRCPYCLLPDQLVQTFHGPIRADDIVPGDQLVGEDWTSRNVVSVKDHEEKTVAVKLVNLPTINISASHPIRTKRGFIQASKLAVGDWVSVPIPILPKPPRVIDLTEWDSCSNGMRTPCVDRLVLTEDVAWLFGLYIAEGSTRVPNKTRTTKSGGGNRNFAVIITLHVKEKDLAERAERVFREAFGARISKRSNVGKAVNIKVHNARIASFFAEVLGRFGTEKRIPLEYVGGHLTGAFLHGLFQGDGCKSLRRPGGSYFWRLSTSHEPVRDGVITLLLSGGLLPNVHTRWPSVSQIDGRVILGNFLTNSISLNGNKAKLLEAWFCGKRPGVAWVGNAPGVELNGSRGFWLRIRDVKKGKRARVVGIEVDGDHTFVVGHVASHNCSVTVRDTHSRIELPRIQKYVADLKSRGLKAAIFTGGGEPTAYPNFDELVRWTKRQGLSVALITNGTLSSRVHPDTWSCFSWVRVSVNIFDGWRQRIRIPREHLASDCVVGCSFVYSVEHEATREEVPFDRAELFAQVAEVADEVGAKYIRVLPNCLLEQDQLILEHRSIEKIAAKLGDARFFHQYKVHGAPNSNVCTQSYFRPYLSEEPFAGDGEPGTVYPCDSVVLNDSAAYFAERYQLCKPEQVLDYLDGKIAQRFDPRMACAGCVFTGNVNQLAAWRDCGEGQFEKFPESLVHEEFV